MSEIKPTTTPLAPTSESVAILHAKLFERLVSSNLKLGLMFFGKVPNPDTGQHETPNPAAGKVFIEELEMIEAKTRGNLTREEIAHLASSLNLLRETYLETVAHISDTNFIHKKD